jgi:hypothetical protein
VSKVARRHELAHRCALMKASRPPSVPLAELETILAEVSEMLGRIQNALGVGALDARVVQCRSAIAACRRYDFSPPLLRALTAKVLEVETDALILRRTLRFSERALASESAGRKRRGTKRRERHERD